MFKAIAALVVAVLMAGCTNVEHGRGRTAPPASVQTAQSMPHQPVPDVKAQLLTLADLSAGCSIDNSSSGDDPSTPPCLQRPDSRLHTADKANASFVKGSSGLPAFAQANCYFGDKAAASGEFSADAAIFNGCKDVSFTSGGQKITGSIRPMSFATFGDQSQAWGGRFYCTSRHVRFRHIPHAEGRPAGVTGLRRSRHAGCERVADVGQISR